MNSQAALSEGPISAPSGRHFGAPLIGNVGQEFVQSALSNDPIAGINEIQTRAALADPRCQPLLGLLHQLGINRADSHKYIVQQATDVLLSRIPTLPGERLLSLLEETFPYITIPDLRAIPLAVLGKLRPVPSTFLKQLASDREIFWELPIGVQRQAWELDKKLLRTHALSLVSAYTYETATWVQALNMDEAAEPALEDVATMATKKGRPGDFAGNIEKEHGGGGNVGDMEIDGTGKPAAGSTGGIHKLPQLARRNLRNGSAALRQLVAMVGSSPSVYRGIVDVCTARFREAESQGVEIPAVGMKDAALCALRSQLLMAMHDAGETSITSGDSCHKLAWTLDACVKDKMFNHRRLQELRNFFSKFIKAAEARRDADKKRRSKTSGRRSQRSGGGDDDAESAGAPGAAATFADDPLRELGAAAMVLRDPAVFHLMLHQIVRCLEKCVETQKVPKEDSDLVFLTQLLTLAVGARAMLRDDGGEYDFPEADHGVLDTLYPLIADLITDAMLMEIDDDEDDGGPGEKMEEEEVEAPPEDMVFLMVKDEVGRRVVQTYALKRLAAGDLKTANRLIQAIEPCIGYHKVAEFAPFAFTLARRLASLLAAGKITTSSSLWRIAVDGVLIRLVDAETEAHEEVLRLLLAAATQLDAATLGRYLARTLANSRISRNEHKNRAADAAGLPPIGYFGPDSTWGAGGGAGGANSIYSPSSGDLVGDWQHAQNSSFDHRGPDGVRGTYALFVSKQPLLNKENAPELFEYLESTAPGETTAD